MSGNYVHGIRSPWRERVRVRIAACLIRAAGVAYGFFVTTDEVLSALEGSTEAFRFISTPKLTFDRYSASPQYPGIILGRLDPFAWAEDPDHRCDVFTPPGNAYPVPESTPDTIRGLAGVPGLPKETSAESTR